MAGDGAVGGDGGDVDQEQAVVYPTLTNDNVNYGGHGDGNEHENVTIFNKVSTNLFNRHRRHNALLTELRTAKNTTDCPSKPNAWPKHIKDNVERRPYFYKCPICLDSVEWRRPLATNCGHVFCSECLSIALALTHTCPVCKIRVSTRRIYRIYI
ncbi:uncharacterized protein Dwil_GK26965 [Drosophila willistoni]|uniref:RING-type domain-containing protein n=2 Tax=Drosophila willistoni TaxID=7260 RepID=A0A0Q9X1D5_DROWI|nr:uncharacterized protein Dwil_GK26965 [Drosophila willistoni]